MFRWGKMNNSYNHYPLIQLATFIFKGELKLFQKNDMAKAKELTSYVASTLSKLRRRVFSLFGHVSYLLPTGRR